MITIESVLADMNESVEILSPGGVAVKPSKLGAKVAQLQKKFDAFAADDERRLAAALPIERTFHRVAVNVVGDGRIRIDYTTDLRPVKA